MCTLLKKNGEGHERLICLSTGKDLDDPPACVTATGIPKSPEQMWAIFGDIPEALEHSLEIANKVEFYSIDSDPMMPIFPIPEDFATEGEYQQKYSEEMLREEFAENFDRLGGYEEIIRVKLDADYLRKITLDGAVKRYGEDLSEEILERIDFELNVVKDMGYPGYFLIVQDFINEARKMGVSVGPGRGSAAGSVVAYCLRITDIDPLKYALLFERFLNPDRISCRILTLISMTTVADRFCGMLKKIRKRKGGSYHHLRNDGNKICHQRRSTCTKTAFTGSGTPDQIDS